MYVLIYIGFAVAMIINFVSQGFDIALLHIASDKNYFFDDYSCNDICM